MYSENISFLLSECLLTLSTRLGKSKTMNVQKTMFVGLTSMLTSFDYEIREIIYI